MTDKIYAGDNGTVLEYEVKDQGQIVNITGCTVTVDFRVKARTFNKQATITDATNGMCEIVLSSNDISEPGTYYMVGLVDFNNGNSFHSDKEYFSVEDPSL